MTRQRRAPLRPVVDRLLLTSLCIETLKCGHQRNFHRWPDRRGVSRWYDDKSRIASLHADKRGCERCADTTSGRWAR